MGLENMNISDSNERSIDSLSYEEVVKEYSSKVEDKNKAEKYLEDLQGKFNEKTEEFSDTTFKGLDKIDLSEGLLRFVSEKNPKLKFGEGMQLDDLKKEEALAVVAYFQELSGLDIDGIIGKKTLGKLKQIHDSRQKLMANQKKDREWLISQIDKELEPKFNKETRLFEMGDLPKSKMVEKAENFEFKSPELKGTSQEQLAAEIKRLENQSEYRRVKKKIPDLMAKYNIQIEGGTPDLVRRAKTEKAKLENVLSYIENKEYDKGLSDGNISFGEAMLLFGVDVPHELDKS